MPHITTGTKENYHHEIVGKYGSAYVRTRFDSGSMKGTLEVWYKDASWTKFELLEKMILNHSFEDAKGKHDSVREHWRWKLNGTDKRV